MTRLVAGALAFALFATVGHAQTITTAGSFARLSPGNQRIATAIFEAQRVSTPPSRLTLDQIAYRKLHDGKGWGVIYQDLQRRGLVTEKNLGQAMKASTASTAPTGRDDRRAGRSDEPAAFGRDLTSGGGPAASGHGMGGGHAAPGAGVGHGGAGRR